MRDLAHLHDLWCNELHTVGGHRKANTIGRCLKLRVDSGQSWNTDDLPLQVDERTTTVARVDRSIRLDGIGDGRNCASQSTDNATRDRLRDPQRVADCQYLLPHTQLRRVTERCHRQLCFTRGDLQHSQVIEGRSSDQLCWKDAAIV